MDLFDNFVIRDHKDGDLTMRDIVLAFKDDTICQKIKSPILNICGADYSGSTTIRYLIEDMTPNTKKAWMSWFIGRSFPYYYCNEHSVVIIFDDDVMDITTLQHYAHHGLFDKRGNYVPPPRKIVIFSNTVINNHNVYNIFLEEIPFAVRSDAARLTLRGLIPSQRGFKSDK